MKSDLIEVDSERLGGTPVFAGTRVPIKNLFDYLQGGDDLDDFLEGFPGVSKDHAVTVVEAAKKSLFAQIGDYE
jgi:uncharacterized protein (DUF433 family)